MRFGFIQGVAIWEKDMVAVIFISPSSQPLQLQLYSYSCNICTWLDKFKIRKASSLFIHQIKTIDTTVHTVESPCMLYM